MRVLSNDAVISIVTDLDLLADDDDSDSLTE